MILLFWMLQCLCLLVLKLVLCVLMVKLYLCLFSVNRYFINHWYVVFCFILSILPCIVFKCLCVGGPPVVISTSANLGKAVSPLSLIFQTLLIDPQQQFNNPSMHSQWSTGDYFSDPDLNSFKQAFFTSISFGSSQRGV